MKEAITSCPCCGSTVRVVPDEARLEIVTMTKPRPEERWTPPVLPKIQRVALPSPAAAASRNRIDREAIAVIERVAAEDGFSLAELRSPQRLSALVATRRRCAIAARAETTASLPQIGRILNRDHSTVLHHLRTPQKEPSERKG